MAKTGRLNGSAKWVSIGIALVLVLVSAVSWGAAIGARVNTVEAAVKEFRTEQTCQGKMISRIAGALGVQEPDK